MRSTGSIPAPAPSTALLRFLRSQFEESCFFKPNPRPGLFIFDHAGLRSSRLGVQTIRKASSVACIETEAPSECVRVLEASLLDLEALWPKRKPRCLQAQHNHSTQTRRHAHAGWKDWRQKLWPERTPPFETYREVEDATYEGEAAAQKNAHRTWREKLLGSKARKRETLLEPGDLPVGPFANGQEGGEDSMFSLGRTIPAREPKLKCTELDENGNVVLVSSEFKKSELIAKYGLLPRDLRKIDSSLFPHILVRPSAILINLLHLRVLIKSDRVLVFDYSGPIDSYSYIQSSFMYDLGGKLRQKQQSPSAGSLPYEFRALEAVLISVTTALENEYEMVRKPVVRILKELEEDIDREKLRKLLIHSKKLGTFEQKAKLVRDAIEELLEADDDLAAMYLTEKKHDLRRGEDDHTEVEMLLESYHKLCDEIVQESGNQVSNIRTTEEIIKAILDANRNALMLLDLRFSIGTLGIGSGAFIAALYGMNLRNFFEEHNMGFGTITTGSFGLAFMVYLWGTRKLRKVQRVSMSGEASGGREEMEMGRRERIRRLKERDERRRMVEDGRGGKEKEKEKESREMVVWRKQEKRTRGNMGDMKGAKVG